MRLRRLEGGARDLHQERGAFTSTEEEEEIDEGEDETQSDSEQVYSEFMETNAAIGSQMRPDPYNVLEIRIDQYLNELVHPVVLALIRFRGKGLLTVERLKEKWVEKMQREKEKEEGGGGGGDSQPPSRPSSAKSGGGGSRPSSASKRPGSAKGKEGKGPGGSRPGSRAGSRRNSFSGIKE